MSLTDTSGRTPTTTGQTNARTLDQDGNLVIVSPMQEAVQDYDWPIVIGAASDKYDAGQIARPGLPPIVEVTKKDCLDWLNGNA